MCKVTVEGKHGRLSYEPDGGRLIASSGNLTLEEPTYRLKGWYLDLDGTKHTINRGSLSQKRAVQMASYAEEGIGFDLSEEQLKAYLRGKLIDLKLRQLKTETMPGDYKQLWLDGKCIAAAQRFSGKRWRLMLGEATTYGKEEYKSIDDARRAVVEWSIDNDTST